MTDCVTKLAEARTALHALITGEQIVSITVNGRTTQYTQGTTNELRRYVRELEAECGEIDADGYNKSRRGAIMFRG